MAYFVSQTGRDSQKDNPTTCVVLLLAKLLILLVKFIICCLKHSF
ncbi:hypothetical protein C8N29_10137 [Agitococcus lubricus]|uniref:Uncharacterized protein n=1 Tax=Agitococcus lubricus TaxID=1077255 RepID=A0A2T5J350_9GAMM|nr:hypothetical protein C8N29_10137 [Agitococcus lubricus]